MNKDFMISFRFMCIIQSVAYQIRLQNTYSNYM